MNLKPVLTFAAGLVLGSGASAVYFKKKHDNILSKELDDLNRLWNEKHPEVPKNKEQNDIPKKNDVRETEKGDMNVMEYYAQKVQQEKYKTKYADTSMGKRNMIRPIPIDERGEMTEYKEFELTLFDDGVLADRKGRIYEVEELFPKELLSHMGEYEQHFLYIIDDNEECYYIIEEDPRAYTEAYPRSMQNEGD